MNNPLLTMLCVTTISDTYNCSFERILNEIKDIAKRNIDDMGLGEFNHAVLIRDYFKGNEHIYVFELWGRGETLWTEKDLENE